jgi:hypothetical protein
MVGVGSDIHAVCLNDDNKRIPCERWFGLKQTLPVNYVAIRHEFDLQLGHYWSSGSIFNDVRDMRAVRAVKVQAMYHYHVTPFLKVGGGGGVMPFYGDGFSPFVVPVLTPASIIVSLPKAPKGLGLLTGFELRPELHYIASTLDGARFGNPVSSYSKHGELNFSLGFGYDFRHIK